MIRELIEKAKSYFKHDKDEENPYGFHGKGFRCPHCGKTLHINCKEEHLDSCLSRGETSDTSDSSERTGRREHEVDMAELLDGDYKLHRERVGEKDDKEAHNRPSSKQTSNFTSPVYNRVTSIIRRRGSCKIRKTNHIGKYRGGHIKQKFKHDVRRKEEDSIENYEIENDGNGEYPIVIRRREK